MKEHGGELPADYEALKKLPNPNEYQFLVFGPADKKFARNLGIKAFYMGYISNPIVMAELYNVCDVFVWPGRNRTDLWNDMLKWWELTEEDIENLQYMVNLKKLILNNATIPDTSVFTKLPALEELYIGNSGVSDFSFLADMPQLKELSISSENITDCSVIGEMTNLTRLKLNNCGLTNVSFLAKLTNLTSLDLDNNDIIDISVVSNMDKLEYLYLVANRNLTDISPVSTLASLKQIDTLNTSVADITPLFGLANLNEITVDGNIIPQEQKDEFKTLHPDCKVEYSH